ncbi:hypothetical protein SISNIDRAFT_429191 [Sistotremastrum niveocremeum HHB9708]|uniref:Receptor-activated Ca2+-permeable cation channel n=2 Tax=Sistotremastraceae TaxID=3402574 RepID=A0A164TPA5_9AGAM|nr:hypothetical protein SISNIDRAFT_429191 [Sistotremastrum niveocremeum HHB9708]KZT42193.1 hypothetical protein SISSUDRAFT_1016315 [Sistotremastrum suecicum HHB10207 ss-3]
MNGNDLEGHDDPPFLDTEVSQDEQVYQLIYHVKKDVLENIDTAFTWDQLNASDMNFGIIRPLVFKYARLKNMAVVYACLAVRAHFLANADADLAYSSVFISRAAMCELLAIKFLRFWASNELELTGVLSILWNPLAGAPLSVVNSVRKQLDGDEENMQETTSALEMAIATKAKFFCATPLVQTVISHVYNGRIVFSTASTRSLLADNYKTRAIEVYDVKKAPFLDHYRLRVPRYGAILEFAKFSLLLLLFVLCLAYKEIDRINALEVFFMVFAAAFLLEEYNASQEHGWRIYFASIWNIFDATSIVIFIVYFVLRIRGIASHDQNASELGFDILACGACLLFPRLVFFVIQNNVIILALRVMVSEYLFFMTIAAICFSGLLFTLRQLAPPESPWNFRSIAWLMTQVWFGNSFLSFNQASSFHPLFGPILMVGFAALSNTLLVTILISILSNTFAIINANATQEYLFQFTISTIKGVKSDALFSYQPPFNLLAYAVLRPLSLILTPRSLHSANVFLIRLTSFPILAIIGIYERYLATRLIEKTGDDGQGINPNLPRHIKSVSLLETIVGSRSSDLIEAVFDAVPDEDEEFELFDHDMEEDAALLYTPIHETPKKSRVPPSPGVDNVASRSAEPSPVRNRKVSDVSIARSSLNREPSMLPSLTSPLARLFRGNGRPQNQNEQNIRVETGIPEESAIQEALKKVESSLEEIKGLPVTKFTEEIKAIQDRQARIENLLLTLTRGMLRDPPSS